MTKEQTRQLGIEFERRVLVMDFDTEFQLKLDTETIYSFLNQYQDKFIHDIYKQLDQISSTSKISSYVETILRGLLKTYQLNVSANNGVYTITLPSDFGLYLSSSTLASKSYRMNNENGSGVIPNILVSQTDADKLMTRPQDSMRIIRQPIAKLNNDNTLSVLCDRYTTPSAFGMTYYKIPKYMNLMTSDNCELPMDVFEDLVSGAVDMYVQYAAGAEARKKQIEQQQSQNAKEQQQ